MTELFIAHPRWDGYNGGRFFDCLSRCAQRLTSLRGWWMTGKNDHDLAGLMRASLAGDQTSYRQFLQEIVPYIRTAIKRAMPYGVADERDDIVQEVLFAIHEKRHTWRVDEPILPWVRAIARYRTIDHLRRLARNKTTPLDEYDEHSDTLTAPHNDPHSDPLEAIDLRNMVQKLSGRIGKVTFAIGIQGKDIATTARELGMSQNAVRIAFHRGLKKLSLRGRQNDKN